MRLFSVLTIACCLLLVSVRTSAQQQGNFKVFSMSTQEDGAFLLYQSKQLRTKAIVAAALGPVLSGTGLLVLRKEGPVNAAAIGNAMAATTSSEPRQVYAGILLWSGVASAVSSIPLFIAAGKAKRKARLMLSDESTTFLHKKISVPSFGIQLSL